MIDLDAIEISDFLPHRAPFLMVEKVIALSEEYVTTSFTILEDNILVNDNTFSEFGLIENAAQTCSAIVGKSYFEEDDIKGQGTSLIGFISAIKKIEVFECPTVNTKIITKAALKSRFDTDAYSICTLECITYIFEKKIATFEMNLFIQEVKK
jgi:predicted hotdog family 3-hydroxylacyl-ACP dehydratase